ncbi:hypothetical protein [Anditalea andensis]|uniref:hypothetical protein n=1 Tax=Anditalea andensis TaxID=1048983 RepID=UPI0013E05058|nr:hypothetical protein [Anditalea andensis]
MKPDIIYSNMLKPGQLFDGRNFLDHAKLQQLGFRTFTIGKVVPPAKLQSTVVTA